MSRGAGNGKRKARGKRPARGIAGAVRRPATRSNRKVAGAGKSRPGVAPLEPATAWWSPWLASLGALLWLAVLVNAAVPVLRCTSVWANKLLFLVAMLVPWYWLRVVRRIPDRRWQAGIAVAAVVCGMAGPVLAWRSGTWTTERREVHSVWLPAGGRVVAREERSPGSLRYRMVARQEREWIPGVLVVRKLAECPDARGGLVELLDNDTVRIRPARVLGEVPVFVHDLKPWGWWGDEG